MSSTPPSNNVIQPSASPVITPNVQEGNNSVDPPRKSGRARGVPSWHKDYDMQKK